MSKSRKRRILGLTISQVTILGCLALAAIGTIFGGFILISSSGTPGGLSLNPSSPPGSSSQVTNVPGQSGPPPVLSTIPPIVSDEQIPADWKPYPSTTIEVRVPPLFESVNPAFEREQRIESYRAQGYAFLADRLANDTFDYRFWFNFPQAESVIYRTHILVRADVLPTLTLDEFIDQAYGAELQGFQVLDRQEMPIGNLQARRVLLSATLNDDSIGVAEYVITDEVNLWVISCSSNFEQFYSWLPDFDRVARSFRLLF